MSDDHKTALAQGRSEGRVVRRYLEALQASKPSRGRKRTAASISKRLATIDDQLTSADTITELKLSKNAAISPPSWPPSTTPST